MRTLQEAYKKVIEESCKKAEVPLKEAEEMDPHSQEAVQARFNKRVELARAAGIEFFKQLFNLGNDTWDKALPEGFSENFVTDVINNSIGENMMARDIKAHFVRVIDDVAPAADGGL